MLYISEAGKNGAQILARYRISLHAKGETVFVPGGTSIRGPDTPVSVYLPVVKDYLNKDIHPEGIISLYIYIYIHTHIYQEYISGGCFNQQKTSLGGLSQ